MKKTPMAVLLVEDDEVDVMNVQRAFKKNNIKNPLQIANNGIEALQILRDSKKGIPSAKPQIVLMDINMPKMNGIELLQEIRKDEELRSLTVFMLTTSNNDQDKIEAYNLNVAGYILKPLSFESFVNAVALLDNYWQLIERPAS